MIIFPKMEDYLAYFYSIFSLFGKNVVILHPISKDT